MILDSNVVIYACGAGREGEAARANVAKTKKATLFLSIHFNASKKHDARGVETLVSEANVNEAEDRAFAQTVQDRLLEALHLIDPSTKALLPKYDWKVKPQSLGVLKDIELGNMVGAHPCRACLAEVEFMDTQAVDALFRLKGTTDGGERTAKNRQRVADALADALLAHV